MADWHQMRREEQERREEPTHPRTACPECDDVQNDCCPSCRGTDEYCPICRIPADDCEFQEGWNDKPF
jgi:hypothetical protein